MKILNGITAIWILMNSIIVVITIINKIASINLVIFRGPLTCSVFEIPRYPTAITKAVLRAKEIANVIIMNPMNFTLIEFITFLIIFFKRFVLLFFVEHVVANS